MNIIKELIEILKDSEQNENIWLNIKKVPGPFKLNVKDVQSGSRVIQIGAKLLWSEKELTTKVGEQPWPQLVHCASICCCMYGYIFQED